MTMSIAVSDPTKQADVGLAAVVLMQWHQADVQYCVWKGTDAVEKGLRGEDDLDLLVNRRHFHTASGILNRHGFQRAVSVNGQEDSGVFHFFGYDPSTQRCLHFHVYTRLLTGESLVLTHWLPLESMLNGNRWQDNGIFLASRPSEFAVFVIRMMIKQGSILEYLWFGSRLEKIQGHFDAYLSEHTSDAASAELSGNCNVMSAELFERSVQVLRRPTSWIRRFAVGRSVRRRLNCYNRFTARERASRYARLFGTKLRRVLGRRVLGKRYARKRLERGSVIAIVGADATGKSTLIADVHQWLSGEFLTRRIHVGKPPGSWWTWPLNGLLPAARLFFPGQRNGRPKQEMRGRPECDSPASQPGVLQAVRALSLAWDRHRLLRRAHRCSANGEVVICDRYTSTAFGAMDSPRLRPSESPRGWKGRLVNFCARQERSLYESNPAPDIVIGLTVSIDVARQRNQLRSKADKHTDEELVRRHESFHLLDLHGTRESIRLDTGQPIDDTIRKVRETIWNAL